MNNLNQEIQQIINVDFESNFKQSISSRNRWNAIYHFCNIFSHLLIGATVILSFVSGGVHLPFLSLVAGSCGVGSQISTQYSEFAFQQYKNQSGLLQQMSKEVQATDDLVDETDVNTPVNSPVITH